MSGRWVKKTLGEVCFVERGSSPRPIKQYLTDSPDGVNWVKIGDTKDVDKYISSTQQKITKEGAEKSRRVDPGDFILSNSMSFGKPYVMATSGYVHDGWFILRLSEGIDTDFFHYLLSSTLVQAQFTSLAAGSVVKNISKDLVKRAILPIPPIAEQKQIVAILDEAFEGIDSAIANTEKNLANARELFESYLNAIFTHQGDDWQEKELLKLVEPECSLSYGIVQPGQEYDSGLPVVRPTDLTTKVIHIKGLKRIDPQNAASYQRTKLLGGELLLCVRGSTGTVSIAADELEGANVTRGIVPIRFESSIVHQSFGYYMLISKVVQDQIKEKTYGAALMQINIRDLKKLTLPFPGLQEQENLAKVLDHVEQETKRLEAIYQQKLAALNELKQSILQKAFSGELTAEVGDGAVEKVRAMNAA